MTAHRQRSQITHADAIHRYPGHKNFAVNNKPERNTLSNLVQSYRGRQSTPGYRFSLDQHTSSYTESNANIFVYTYGSQPTASPSNPATVNPTQPTSEPTDSASPSSSVQPSSSLDPKTVSPLIPEAGAYIIAVPVAASVAAVVFGLLRRKHSS